MASSMPNPSSSLFSLARSKLHLSVGGKGDCSLHRWVLLKNSIIHSQPLTIGTATDVDSPDVNTVYPIEQDGEDDEVGTDEEADSFMFPDLVDGQNADVNSSEAEWLDSLLESLGDDNDDEYRSMDVQVSVLPVDDDEDQSLSPLISPMSSSDDLVSQPAYYPPPIVVPYPVPYPPFHPPLVRSFDLDDTFEAPLSSSLPQYADALPYYDSDDVEDLSVPDAIEDTSDDESDAPTTPSLSQASPNFGFVDPASIPLPIDRVQRRPHPIVYIDEDDSYFYPFEIDPLPFPHHQSNTYNTLYQEC